MKPLVTFADPEVAIKEYYKAVYVGDLADQRPATITTDPVAVTLADTTHLQVALDGSFTNDYPATDRATIRVNCSAGAGHRSDVKAMASLAQGLLSVHPGDDDVWGTVPLVGRSAVITDPDTKNLMVWFTFRVNMRPIKVAV